MANPVVLQPAYDWTAAKFPFVVRDGERCIALLRQREFPYNDQDGSLRTFLRAVVSMFYILFHFDYLEGWVRDGPLDSASFGRFGLSHHRCAVRLFGRL